MARGESKGGLKAESWMAGLKKYAGDFLRWSCEALEAGFTHLASKCPVTWRCWMRHVSLHPSSFALPPWLRPRSNGHRRMPRQSRLRPSPRSRRKICRRAMGEEGGESFDHLVCAREQYGRNFKADRAGGWQVDDQFKLSGPHYREVGRLGALEDFAGVDTGLTVRFRLAGSVAHQAAGFRKVAQGVDRRNRMSRRQRGNLKAPADKERIRADQERVGSIADKRPKGSLDLATVARLQDVDLKPDRGRRRRHIPCLGVRCRKVRIDKQANMRSSRNELVHEPRLF